MSSEYNGAPFSQTFYTNGEITAVNISGSTATVSYRGKDDTIKSANFSVNDPKGFKVGETVSVQLVDEFVFISKL